MHLFCGIVSSGEFSGPEPPGAYVLMHGRSIMVSSDLPHAHDARSKMDITSSTRSTISSPSAPPPLHCMSDSLGICTLHHASQLTCLTLKPSHTHIVVCMLLLTHVRAASTASFFSLGDMCALHRVAFPGRPPYASHRMSLPYKTPLTSQFILLPLQLHHCVRAPSKPSLSQSISNKRARC